MIGAFDHLMFELDAFLRFYFLDDRDHFLAGENAALEVDGDAAVERLLGDLVELGIAAGQRHADIGAASARIEVDCSPTLPRDFDQAFDEVVLFVGEIAGERELPTVSRFAGWIGRPREALGRRRRFHGRNVDARFDAVRKR